jgi:hypothetical protein
MRELFVYYRVQARQAREVLTAVQAFQSSLLEQYPQLRTRLLRRPGETEGQQTWMETYATDPLTCPEGISEGLQSDIETQAQVLSSVVSDTRHVEVFNTMNP